MSSQETTDGSEPNWKALPDHARQAMTAAWSSGMPSLASAVHARWWQLESWLRSLVYVELRAAHAGGWADALPKESETRQQGDVNFQYMATPDAQNRLAYADASALFRITLEHWPQFAGALPAKNVWAGRIEELRAIRNRIGHCRRPHLDDLARLEQTLRDLETGAFQASASFNNRRDVKNDWSDAVVDGWVRRHHETAIRLIDHARRQYETSFALQYSRRPWAALACERPTISGLPGYIWHASWYFGGACAFDLQKFWRATSHCHDIIFLVCADGPSSVSVSFSVKEDPVAVADAIGYCFDAALMSLARGCDYGDYSSWRAQYADLDARVHVFTPWSFVEESMRNRISIFGA